MTSTRKKSPLLKELINLNIERSEDLPSPFELCTPDPVAEEALQTVVTSRKILRDILDGKDPRFVLVVGPCSIHDEAAAYEYAEKLKQLADKVSDRFLIIMRVYFEKPRTTVGWKGLINDPDLDDSFRIVKGIRLARKILQRLNEMGLPCATEALDPIIPQYLSELITWAAIGARTTESQTHREMASGLSMPVGIKNGTDGSVQVAVNALTAIQNPQSFLGINYNGEIAKFITKGNPYGHVVLRGGGGKPNYDHVSVVVCEKELEAAGLKKKIMVDCSHANSDKDHTRQPLVLEDCIGQILSGNQSLMGFMIESHLHEGNQKFDSDLSKLEYGVSITDKCVGWEQTEEMILKAYEKLKLVGA